MIQMMSLAILFIVTLILQSSFIMALGEPFHLISLPLLIGTLILHRGSIHQGLIWFTLVAALQWIFGFAVFSFWIYPLIALIGSLLVSRLFTKHSTYAFIELFITLLTTAFILQWIESWNIDLSTLFTALLLSLPISYIAMTAARMAENFFTQFLFERS